MHFNSEAYDIMRILTKHLQRITNSEAKLVIIHNFSFLPNCMKIVNQIILSLQILVHFILKGEVVIIWKALYRNMDVDWCVQSRITLCEDDSSADELALNMTEALEIIEIKVFVIKV